MSSATMPIMRTLIPALLVLASCYPASESPPTDPIARLSASSQPLLQPSAYHPGERSFEEVSRSAGGFAGYVLESGRPVVYVTDLADATATKMAAEPVLRRELVAIRQPVHWASEASVRKVRYSFAELRDWRNHLMDQVFQIAGVVLLDLDEARNRITVGLTTDLLRAAVEKVVRDLRIPSEAVLFEVTGEIRPDINLDDEGPLEGALRVEAAGEGGCTLGFNTMWLGQFSSFVTASHCTPVTWEDDGVSVYQPKDTIGFSIVGVERWDPHWQYCGGFSGCRLSDAAVIRYNGSPPNNFGYIARTIGRVGGPGGQGSLTIESANPRIPIVGTNSFPVAGTIVEKIGQTTGWTFGQVTNTCFPVVVSDGFMRLCSYQATYGSGPGDSGSPVFSGILEAVLTGVHFASDGRFSPFGGIVEDLGQLDVTTTSSALSASISGPFFLDATGTYEWQAVPSGGNGTYAYQWYVGSQTLGTNQIQSMYVDGSGSFTMSVTVTSGLQQVTPTHFVQWGEPPCCDEAPPSGRDRAVREGKPLNPRP